MTEINIITDRDTYTNRSSPDTNFGISTILVIDYTTTVPFRHAQPFLHFPMTEIPDSATIKSALLYMYVYSIQPYTQNTIYSPNTDWDEYTLTWNNKPYVDWASDGYMSCDSVGWHNADIMDFVNGWLTNKWDDGYGTIYPFPNYGIEINPEYAQWASSAHFYSREKTNYEPYIKVIYEEARPLWTGPYNALQII